MTIEALLIWLLIGAVAGFLAGIIVRGYGFGAVGNVIIGMLGAAISGWLLPLLGIIPGGNIGGQIVASLVGAVLLLLVAGAIRRPL